MVSLSLITIPTPQPYDDKNPDQQRENLAYVQLQILTEAKAAGDNDPFGYVEALQMSAAAVSVEMDDLSVKISGQAAILESP